ncbi:RING finger protein 145 [Acipenser ruthenus]|uniref:RING finger protein 145 n=1 Tax=Acipenser ruthenus TaxID=7906 RepID=A0A444UZZ5_ACIRT|nr:RING finger protein 145 [Acipenser ruthenus]
MAVKDKLKAVLNVGLRVPSIMLLDVLYRWDVSSFFQQIQKSPLNNNPLFQYKYLALNMHYVGYILSVVLLTLPRQQLVQLYLYVLTALLLFAGHQISRDYVRNELESEYDGPIYLEPLTMNRFTTALIGQLVVCTLCSCVMRTKQIWLFSAHLLPLVARLCLVPLETIVFVNRFAMIFTGLEVLYFLASNLLVPFNLAKTAYRELAQVVEVYGLLALGMSLWNQLVVPVLFMVFWLVLFALQIYSYFSTRDQPTSRERLLFFFLTSIAECCSTPYSLLGLVFTVSFVALGVLTLCKFYLQGYRAFMNDNTMNRGMTEGITLLILAVQTGLIELQVIHRAFLLSIILFIVVASILQSMLEIADPIVLALGASRDNIAECCSTPYSLLGLVFTVSFVALGVLTLCKFYLQGYRAFMNDNTMNRSSWYWMYENRSNRTRYGDPFPVNIGWRGIPSSDIDAFIHVWTWNINAQYFFKGTQYWRYDPDNDMIFTEDPEGVRYPKLISEGFPGAPSPIDTAFFDKRDRNIYFFRGSQVTAFSVDLKQKVSGYPKQIVDVFPATTPGDHPIGNIDSVYYSYTTNSIYFIKDTLYWKVVTDNDRIRNPSYPYNGLLQQNKVSNSWFDICDVHNSVLLMGSK